jgi:hypothetical protein
MNRTRANVRLPAQGTADFYGFQVQPDMPDIDRTKPNVRTGKASRRPDRHGHTPLGGVQLSGRRCPTTPPMGFLHTLGSAPAPRSGDNRFTRRTCRTRCQEQHGSLLPPRPPGGER